MFSHSVMSKYLCPHGLKHTRFPHASLFPRVYWNSCSLRQWYHPTISSFVIPISSCLQSSSASGSLLTSRVFASDGQSIGTSASALVLLMNIQGWFSLGLTGRISLLSKGLWRVSPPTLQVEGISSLALSIFYSPALTSIHDCWKNHNFDYTDICWKITPLLFNTLSRFVIVFLPRSKCHLISCLQ